MLIRYLGEYTREARAYGCSKCGTGTSSIGKEVYKTQYRTYFDGRLIIFKQGEVVKVDEVLGKFLLTKKHRDKQNYIKNSFELVTEDGASEPSEAPEEGQAMAEPPVDSTTSADEGTMKADKD